jgi:hypothetical protein
MFDPTALCPRVPAPGVRVAAHPASSPEPRPLPAFLSPAPPRSEGEALLRRIFARSGQV